MKIITIVGARPQFVKAAVVSRAMREHADLTEIIVHTGQHFDHNMSQVFFDEMDIPKPDYNLGIGGGTHGQNTGRMIEKIEEVLFKKKPDWVLVYGDTDSTLAGTLATAKLHIPVAHVEAGLRSYNRNMPEEFNRVLTDHAADLLFAPTQNAVKNLAKEGIIGDKVIRTGDVMYDATLYYKSSARRPDTPNLPDSGFALCTLHRAENTDDPMRLQSIMTALAEISQHIPVVLPLHPRTRARLTSLSSLSCISRGSWLNSPNLRTTPPVSYLEMVWLLEHCQLVLTDSGGLQKEAYFFQKPCITLREETEWVELVEAGANILAGSRNESIQNAFKAFQNKTIPHGNLYGNGHSAQFMIKQMKK